LPWHEVDEIRERLNHLNPYDRALVPDLVKLEDENFARRSDGSIDRSRRVRLYGLGISAKRYALYEHGPGGETVLRKRSEHGLGALLSPIAAADPESAADGTWIDEVWLRFIARARGMREPATPDYYRRPALSRVSASSAAVLAPFQAMNAGRSFAQQVKPANFLLLAHDDPLVALPDGLDPERLTLIAPYSNKPEEWLDLEYRNRFDGNVVAVTTSLEGSARAVRIKTYGDVIAEYGRHPETKSGDAEGRPCTRATVGLLTRLHVRASRVRHIGKESNHLEEVEAGGLRTTEDPVPEYVDVRGEWEAALPVLREIGIARLAQMTGMAERTLRSRLNHQRLPHREARKRLLAIAEAAI